MKPLPKISGINTLCRLADSGRDFVDWYEFARRDIEYVCGSEIWCPRRFSAVLSITSPRVAVARNVRTAFRYMSSGRCFANTMSGTVESLARFELTGQVSPTAQKVSAFFLAITGDSESIVLDVWIAKALRVSQAKFKNRTLAKCVDRMRAAAEFYGLTPRDYQACVWAGTIRSVGRNPPQFGILAEYKNWIAHGRDYPESGSIPVLTEGVCHAS